MDHHNLWNPVLDVPQIEEVPHHVARKARLKDPFDRRDKPQEKEEEEENDGQVLGRFLNYYDENLMNYFLVLARL